jgi:hypothetical protein
LDLNVMNNYIVQESDDKMTPAHYVDSTTWKEWTISGWEN